MLLPIINAVALAIASSGGFKCELYRSDSAFVAGKPLYRRCAVDKPALRIDEPTGINFRPIGNRGCYKATIEFVVDENGMVETDHVRIVLSTAPDLAQAVINTLPQSRYRPAQKAGVAVRQIERMEVAVMARMPGAGRPVGPTATLGC